MDVFRHVGRGELTPFAGGAAANRALEQEFWRTAPYTEADLQGQIDDADELYGAGGAQALARHPGLRRRHQQLHRHGRHRPYFPGEYV